MKKIFVIFLLSLLVVNSLLLPLTVKAQNPWYEPTMSEFADRVTIPPAVEVYGERYTYAQTRWIIMSIIFWFIPIDTFKCLDQSNGIFNVIPDCARALIGQGKSTSPITTLASYADLFLNTKPISGVQYLSATAANLHIIPEARAQGYGYGSGILPAKAMWTAARNAAYSLMILAIIILAFLIMFRVQISPRVVITVQSAIPKIAFALVLITFSYAIAGLFVDMAFLVQGLLASIAHTAGLVTRWTLAESFTKLQDVNGGTIAFAWFTIVRSTLNGGIACVITGIPVVCNVFDLIISLILFLVIFITIFRIFWVLLKTYAVLLILIIAGPFIILGGLISSQVGFMYWLKQIIANLSVFVMATLLVFMAHVFAWGMSPTGYYGALNQWDMINPYRIDSISEVVGTGRLPGFSFPNPNANADNTAALGFLVGLVMIIAVPSLSQAAKNFILGLRGQYGGEVAGAAAMGALLGRGVGGETLSRFAKFGAGGGGYEALRQLIPGAVPVLGAASAITGAIGRTRAGRAAGRVLSPITRPLAERVSRTSGRIFGSERVRGIAGGIGRAGLRSGTEAGWWKRTPPGES